MKNDFASSFLGNIMSVLMSVSSSARKKLTRSLSNGLKQLRSVKADDVTGILGGGMTFSPV